ncbi:response regulator [Sanyastnella coralliicola]|uniref:response regulator n=1 Tax=Sanyastnella coralliicola TaxID=3069118 RepID=UPI0027BAD940|nr:response regulator [Longitalea sp. SCSIO 12813]
MEINIAGRQRTYVQQIAKLSLEIRYQSEAGEVTQDEVNELRTVSKHWEDSHRALLQGSELFDIDGENSTEIKALFDEVRPVFFELKDNVRTILDNNGQECDSAITNILRKDDQYQDLMNRVVYQYTSESAGQISRLRTLSWTLAITTLLVLFLAFMFIIRPVLNKLGMQNDELLELNRNLEKVSQIKSDFLANMSHEVRTPMNGILGMADLLENTKLDKDQRDYVQTIRNSSENLLVIINDILDYSKIESGKMELEQENFDLHHAIEEVVDLLRPTAYEKRLELMMYFEPEVPNIIRGDVTRLKQVLINLLNNAIKFTDKGEILLRVEHVTTEHDFMQIQFSVKDTGIGIDPENINHLFQSFTQADTSTTRQYGGTGLGLAICKRIVQLMGGRIWVNSSPGKGSTFFFTIITEKAGEDGATSEIGGLQGLKALIVDDNTTNLKILVKQLSNWGIQATPFNSPELVLEILDNLKKFDFCILDMQMPGIDGKQLTKEIRKHYTPEELPVIVLSSIGTGILDDQSGLWNRYLTKPVKPMKLLTTIKKVSGLAEEEREMNTAPLANTNEVKEAPVKDLNILVAEDNEIHQAVVSRTLSVLGYRAEKAYNGYEVLEKISGGDYDMILMDLEMPVMDGLEATRKIKTMLNRREAPVIIGMSASSDAKEKKSCLSAGMDDYMNKPLDPDKLNDMINEWFPNLNSY